MKTELRNSIFAGLAFGILITPFMAFFYNIYIGIIVGIAAGALFGIKIYSFMTSKFLEQETQIEESKTELIIYSGGANHFVGAEAVGGKLYLLADKLQFKSHSANIQNHEMTINLDSIDEVGFYRTLGIVPNGLFISAIDGNKEKFVVNNKNTWKEQIEKTRDKIIKF